MNNREKKEGARTRARIIAGTERALAPSVLGIEVVAI